VGPKSAYPDEKPDVAFSLALSESLGRPDAEVASIEIAAVAGPPGRWSTAPKGGKEGFIGVASARRPSITLNPEGGPLKINPAQENELLLFVNDDGQFAKKGRRYQVKVIHKDRSSWSIPVSTAQVDKQLEAPTSVPRSAPLLA